MESNVIPFALASSPAKGKKEAAPEGSGIFSLLAGAKIQFGQGCVYLSLPASNPKIRRIWDQQLEQFEKALELAGTSYEMRMAKDPDDREKKIRDTLRINVLAETKGILSP